MRRNTSSEPIGNNASALPAAIRPRNSAKSTTRLASSVHSHRCNWNQYNQTARPPAVRLRVRLISYVSAPSVGRKELPVHSRHRW